MKLLVDEAWPLRFVRGHMVQGQAYKFPHLCPGAGCAIAAWIEAKCTREQQALDMDIRAAISSLR